MPSPPNPAEYERFFYDNYNTHLDPEQEAQFQTWAQQNNRQNDLHDYDMRGAWLEGAKQGGNGHFSDKYKKPNHPTFSDQSIYNGTESPWGWKYEGGKWTDNTYTPSQRMFVRTHNREQMKKYMAEHEPGVRLIVDQN